MRLNMISRIIHTEVNVIYRAEDRGGEHSPRSEQLLISCVNRIEKLFYYCETMIQVKCGSKKGRGLLPSNWLSYSLSIG